MHQSIILAVALVLGATTAQAAQLPQPNTPQKETSIIKNVAAALKTPISQTTATSKHSALEQLLQQAEQGKTVSTSPEESRALAKLNSRTPNALFTQNRKFSSIFQRLFGG
ncbi:MAG: hypothetical protein E6Q25_00440 [Acinetobacter sp.]|jgi:acyl-CoA synthetase (NDP forming)|nr:MAG: hypothetical protein E6Q25_00440 [Acinetobacter sp.]